MSEPITLSAESVEAVAQRTAELLGAAKRPELSRAEVMQLTGHRSDSALDRWLNARRVKPISRGRYRRSAILRALGGAA